MTQANVIVLSIREEQAEEFERLRAWRWERAEGKPAYTVAANAVLEEVLRRRPANMRQLVEIRGIGGAFCEKHGESMLAAVRELDERDDDPRFAEFLAKARLFQPEPPLVFGGETVFAVDAASG